MSRILFFGLGSIGRKHAGLLREHFDHELYAFRHAESRKNDLDIEEIYDLDDIERIKPDFAFITNPTSEHIRYAEICARKGMDLFIEKPLSDRRNVSKLRDLIKETSARVYVAYCLRFHPALKWMKEHLKDKELLHVSIYNSSYLPDWREGNHLDSYSASRELGGGVILDLSHEIDYLHYLFDNKISEIKVSSGRVGNVTRDSEDYADILLKCDGIPVNIHLDFMSYLKRREVIVDFTDHTVVVDLIKSQANLIGDEEVTKEFKNDMYLEQLKSFFSGDVPDFDEALEVFDSIMRIKEAAS